MDKMDRMLRALPREAFRPELAASIRTAIHRRHRRRLLMRRAGASLLAVLGAWLLSPSIAWLSPNQLFASGAPWLLGSLQYLNYQSGEMLGQLWSDTSSMQGAIGSTLAVSVLIGALLLSCSILLAVDPVNWQAAFGPNDRGATSTILTSSAHL